MASNKGLLKEIEGKSGSFALVFLVLFGLTFGFLALVGATPDDSGVTPNSDLALRSSGTPAPPTVSSVQPTNPNVSQPQPTLPSTGELPIKIVVKKIGLNVLVTNPNSTDVHILDAALLKGAIRYPTSGQLGENGTVVIFGHSSYLPVVHNKVYKAFDGIQDLQVGDIVSVYSGHTEYQFSVTGVRVADANIDTIPLPQDAEHLTLVTCDSFTSKNNRFVVTADLLGIYPLR